MNPELKHHFEQKGLQFVGQDVEGERMEIIQLEGELIAVLPLMMTSCCVSGLMEVKVSRLIHFCCFRSLLLCRRAVPPRVHLQAYQTFSSILWSPAGFCKETPELPGQGLPPVSTVTIEHNRSTLGVQNFESFYCFVIYSTCSSQ